MIKNAVAIILVLIAIAEVRSDLPVHCLASDIEGEWEFTISREKFNPSLKEYETTCGHGFPNTITQIIGDKDNDDQIPFARKITIELRKDYHVYKNNKIVGTWTPIFDQSLLINYKKSILTAPFKYYLDEPLSTKFISNCGKTLKGWYISNQAHTDKNWSCFFGKKISPTKKKDLAMIQTDKKNLNELLFEVLYDDFEDMVDEINKANLTWKAEMNPKFKGMTFPEIMDSLGLTKGHTKKIYEQYLNDYQSKLSKKTKKQSVLTNEKSKYEKFKEKLSNAKNTQKTSILIQKEQNERKTHTEKKIIHNDKNKHEPDSQFVTDPAEITKYINKTIEEINEKHLPLNWDWRNVGGESYVGKPRSQGNCGSCYAFSAISSLESRLRVKTNNKDQTRFSVQFPISCNFYSEGCDGGYAILVGKFLNEFEVVPEECFKYVEDNSQCANVCDYTKYPKKYKVSKYGYLGNVYGNTTEVDMMKEIRARGPIPGNVLMPSEISFYKSGIFSTKGLKQNENTLNYKSLLDDNVEFGKVEHSITIVGYGEENGVKYWICMNSWGGDWGEKGFFKVLRGENEINIETMGDFLNIEIEDRK